MHQGKGLPSQVPSPPTQGAQLCFSPAGVEEESKPGFRNTSPVQPWLPVRLSPAMVQDRWAGPGRPCWEGQCAAVLLSWGACHLWKTLSTLAQPKGSQKKTQSCGAQALERGAGGPSCPSTSPSPQGRGPLSWRSLPAPGLADVSPQGLGLSVPGISFTSTNVLAQSHMSATPLSAYLRVYAHSVPHLYTFSILFERQRDEESYM